MNVADFQELARGIARALGGASAKVEDELQRLADGLEPFKAWTVGQFAQFLVKAEEYSRTGAVSANSARKQVSQPDPRSVEQSVAQLQELFDNATDAATTYSSIQQHVKSIGKRLKKQEAMEVGRLLGIRERMKSKKDALEKIENHIARRKEGHQHLTSVRQMGLRKKQSQ